MQLLIVTVVRDGYNPQSYRPGEDIQPNHSQRHR